MSKSVCELTYPEFPALELPVSFFGFFEEGRIFVYPLPEGAVSGLSGLVGYGEILRTRVAEGVGFEPTVVLRRQQFSRRIPPEIANPDEENKHNISPLPGLAVTT